MSQPVATLGGVVELTDAQAEAVGRDGTFCLLGEAGSGKTTVLLRRYLDRVRTNRTGRVLVVCRNRATAQRFRRAAVRELAGGFDRLAITSIWALAFDIIARRSAGADNPDPLMGAERRVAIDRLLATEAGHPELWPTLHGFVGRTAFADAVERGLATLAALAPNDVRATPDFEAPWAELAAFAHRFAAHCESRGVVDTASVVQHAAQLLGTPAVCAEEAGRFDEILVDDAETTTPAAATLLGALGETTPLIVALNPAGSRPEVAGADDLVRDLTTVELGPSFRRPAAPELIECRHPSVEPEALVGELLRAHERGVEWHEMAVIAPAGRIAAIARSTARHNIPTAAALRHGVVADPLTRGIVDLVLWAAGDDTVLPGVLSSPIAGLDAASVRAVQRDARAQGTSIDELPVMSPLLEARAAIASILAAGDTVGACHEAFRRSAAGLVRLPGEATTPVEQRSLDAALAFLNGLGRVSHPADVAAYASTINSTAIEVEPWWGPPDDGPPSQAYDDHDDGETDAAGVTLTTVAGAAGREWELVVVAGCVEGTLPRLRRPGGLFQPSVLSGSPSADDTLRQTLEFERRRFAAASSRAISTLLATSAPEPGVLVSRFVDDWPRRAAHLPLDAPATPAGVPPSEGIAPVFPEGHLRLSASQLDTYEDCPLKYAYRYAAGVRTEAGLHADLGTVTHDALAAFLDPTNPVPCTREALFETADAWWRDDIAPYRPQIEEARRDYYAMLDAWWEGEGHEIAAGRIEVLATEYPFEVAVGPHRITGRIDRIDRSTDGTGIRVLDYKTGKSRPRPDDVAANIQLGTYHLAARRDESLRSLGEPTELRLLYVRSMKPYDQIVTENHEAATEVRIIEAANRILAEEFEPAVDADCDHCEFRRLCPLWPEGLEVGER